MKFSSATRATCPRCGRRWAAIVTAYGWRAVCAPCNVRLTWIFGHDLTWQVERR